MTRDGRNEIVPSAIDELAAIQTGQLIQSHAARVGVPTSVIYVNNAQRPMGVSGFGVASLVLGIVAAVVCWMPLLGMAAIPIAAIGGLLGVVGFLVSAVGRRSSVGLPIAGLFTCALAFGISVFVTGRLAEAIDRAEKIRTGQTVTVEESAK